MKARGTGVPGRRLGVAACVVALGMLWWPSATGPVAAGTAAQTGWWHRLSGESGAPSGGGGDEPGAPPQPPPTLPPAPLPIPTVPVGEDGPPAPPAATPPAAAVPEGGLYVANDVFGPLAMAAVRFEVGAVGNAVLRLRFAEGAVAAGLPIVACPLLEGFQAVTNGAWRDRPAHGCDRAAISGSLGSDGILSFTLSSAFQQAGATTLDVVLLPLPGDGTPFSAPFDAVRPGDLEMVGPPPTRPPATSGGGSGGGGGSSGSGAGGESPSGGGTRPTPGVPARPGSVPGGIPAASGGGQPAAPGSRPVASPGVEPVAELFEDRPWARWVATAILAAAALALAASATGRLPGAARASTATARGVGRFSRQREGPPPVLS